MALKPTNERMSNRRVAHPLSFYVVAIDPGGTTGWAVAHYNTLVSGPLCDVDQIQFESGQFGPHKHHAELYEYLIGKILGPPIPSPNVDVICESFEFRQRPDSVNRTKLELVSKEYIGVLELLLARLGGFSLHYQTASKAKSLLPDKGPKANLKLRQIGWYRPNLVHANDAARHLARHLVIEKKIRGPFLNRWIGDGS
jgi:hypothetical protein